MCKNFYIYEQYKKIEKKKKNYLILNKIYKK